MIEFKFEGMTKNDLTSIIDMLNKLPAYHRGEIGYYWSDQSRNNLITVGIILRENETQAVLHTDHAELYTPVCTCRLIEKEEFTNE